MGVDGVAVSDLEKGLGAREKRSPKTAIQMGISMMMDVMRDLIVDFILDFIVDIMMRNTSQPHWDLV